MADRDDLPVTGPIEKDDEYSGPSVPVIGLVDLPKLPTTELAMAEREFVLEAFSEYVAPPSSWAALCEKVADALKRFDDRTTFDQAPLSAVSSIGLLALRPSRGEELSLGPESLARDCSASAETGPNGALR